MFVGGLRTARFIFVTREVMLLHCVRVDRGDVVVHGLQRDQRVQNQLRFCDTLLWAFGRSRGEVLAQKQQLNLKELEKGGQMYSSYTQYEV
jgi:hypothetical protein